MHIFSSDLIGEKWLHGRRRSSQFLIERDVKYIISGNPCCQTTYL